MTKAGEDTRRRLINTAHHLIWASSYGSVSVDEICMRADVRKGSFYHFFPSKADLLAAAMDDHWEMFRPLLDDAFSPIHTPHMRLQNFCRLAIEKQREAFAMTGKVCGCPYATLASEVTSQEEKIRAAAEMKMRHFVRYFETLLQDAAMHGQGAQEDIVERANDMYTFGMGVLTKARICNSLSVIENELEPGLFRIAVLRVKQLQYTS